MCQLDSRIAFSMGNKSALHSGGGFLFIILHYKIEIHCLFFSEGLEVDRGKILLQAEKSH